nr:proline-rich receptor-like protein kinase PERK10 [Aegilops tauschii subsp. strangulata]
MATDLPKQADASRGCPSTSLTFTPTPASRNYTKSSPSSLLQPWPSLRSPSSRSPSTPFNYLDPVASPPHLLLVPSRPRRPAALVAGDPDRLPVSVDHPRPPPHGSPPSLDAHVPPANAGEALGLRPPSFRPRSPRSSTSRPCSPLASAPSLPCGRARPRPSLHALRRPLTAAATLHRPAASLLHHGRRPNRSTRGRSPLLPPARRTSLQPPAPDASTGLGRRPNGLTPAAPSRPVRARLPQSL